MQNRQSIEDSGKRNAIAVGFGYCWLRIALCLIIAGCFSTARGMAQAVNTPPKPHSIILPEANRPPDANEQMLMHQQTTRKQNFEAANALRQKQINDDVAKLLILAKDFNAEMAKLGDKPLPEKLGREAAVIELLAHDVHTRMTLTVRAD